VTGRCSKFSDIFLLIIIFLVVPTSADLDRHIMPALHEYMTHDGLEIWQIDEWLRRIRIEFDKSSGERNDAMQFITHNIFHGNNPPRSIRKFFPKPMVCSGVVSVWCSICQFAFF